MSDSTTTVASELEDSSRKVTDHPYLSWFDYAVLGAYLMGMLGFLIGNCFGSNYTPPAPGPRCVYPLDQSSCRRDRWWEV